MINNNDNNFLIQIDLPAVPHPLETLKGVTFTCEIDQFCEKEFTSEEELDAQPVVSHPIETPKAITFKCKIDQFCRKEFSTEEELDQHCQIHFPDCEHLLENNKCRFCKISISGKIFVKYLRKIYAKTKLNQ